MSTFALDLAKFAEKAKERADEAVGAVVVGIAAELDRRSPVGDAIYWKHPAPKGYVGGHFRANWQLAIGSMPNGEVPGVDPTGASAQARIMAAIPDEASGLVYYIANNVPYAQRIEYGWSRQAPEGLVGLTTLKFREIVENAVAGSKP